MTDWTCVECASTNSAGERECSVCGAFRPGGRESSDRPAPMHESHRAPVVESFAPVPVAPSPWPDRRVTPARGRAGPMAAVVLVGVALALVAGAYPLVDGWLSGADGGTGTGAYTQVPPASTAAAPTGGGGGTAEPAPFDRGASPSPAVDLGVMKVAGAAAGHPEATNVATMLAGYYSAINNGDYATLKAFYDPRGVVNPDDARQWATFTQSMSTTVDSEVLLRGIATTANGVTADVVFISNQSPGFGPRGREQETCTRWTVSYTLSRGGAAGFRIVRSTAQSLPC